MPLLSRRILYSINEIVKRYLLDSYVGKEIDHVLDDLDVKLDVKSEDLIAFEEPHKDELLLVWLGHHLVVELLISEGVQVPLELVEKALSEVTLLVFVESPCIGHLALTEETRLIFLDQVEDIALNLEQPRSQIAL